MGTPANRRDRAAKQRARFRRNRKRWPEPKPVTSEEELVTGSKAERESARAYLKAVAFTGLEPETDEEKATIGYKAYHAGVLTKRQARRLGCVIK